MGDKRVIDFLHEHHLAAFSVCNNQEMWCWSAFYTFIECEFCLVITSEEKTKHIQILKNSKESMVCGIVALETTNIGQIRGVQFKGEMTLCSEESYFNKYRVAYLKQFPFAVLKGADLWIVKINELKFTDNRLGFGKKLLWSRPQ